MDYATSNYRNNHYWGIRIINQYERGVVFRLAKLGQRSSNCACIYYSSCGPDAQSPHAGVDPGDSQKIITKDNVSIDVSAVAYYQVTDLIKSVVEIQNVVSAIYQIAQTTVRNIVARAPWMKFE